METNERLNNTIKIVADVLERHKEKENVKEAYEDILKLKKKKNIKNYKGEIS